MLSFGATALLLLERYKIGHTGFSHISAHGLCQERLYSRMRNILGAVNRRGVLRHTDGESEGDSYVGWFKHDPLFSLCLEVAAGTFGAGRCLATWVSLTQPL